MAGTGQGKKITGSAAAIDLDAMVAAQSLEPAVIRLFGEEWSIRRDLSPNEAVKWVSYMRAPDTVTVEQVVDGEVVEREVSGEAAAWALLLGDLDRAVSLNERLLDLPRLQCGVIGQECIRLAGLEDMAQVRSRGAARSGSGE